MTNLMPGIVIEVSAMLVANIHFLDFAGVEENIRACREGGRDAYIGNTKTCVRGSGQVGLRRRNS